LGLNPAEKAAIEAERQKSAAVRRWYPESPLEGEEGLSQEERKKMLIKWLKEDIEEEEKGAKAYRLHADWLEKIGEPGFAAGLIQIAVTEDEHKEHIKNILRQLGETV